MVEPPTHAELRRQLDEARQRNLLLQQALEQSERLSRVAHDALARVRSLERELQDSRAFLQQVLADSPDPLAVVDARGRVALTNRALERLLEVPEGALVGRRALRYLPAEQRRSAVAGLRATLTGGARRDVPVRLRGTDRRLEIRAARLDRPGGAGAQRLILLARDVTEAQCATEALRESERRFRTVADHTYDWEYWLDAQDCIAYMSPSCQRFTGYSAAEFKQDRSLLLRIVHPEDRAQVAEHECEARGCDREMLVDFRVLARDGHERWVSHVCVPVHDQDGTPQGRRISNRDITDRKRLEAQLQHLASHDSLTGLLGRAELQRRFQGELERALRYGRPLALLMFDADHFKAINDRHGHLAGDRVLAALAQCMRTNLRGSDLVGRYGGEEFLAVLPETGIEQAAAMAERLRRRVAARDFAPPGAVQLAVTVSVGVAALGLHGDDPEALVDAADQALYAAKAAGRDRVVCAAALG